MDYKSAQKVDYFVANSKTVQQRIKDFYHRESVVIYPPVDLLERVSYDFRNQKIGDYYLVVSRLEKLKHIDIIVEAFTKIGFPLVVVGTGIESDYLQSLAGNSIKFAGFATDEEICRYYSECKAFIVAAEDEDFGITAVEAQLFGKGVIAPRQGGFLETIIDGETGLFFDRIEVQSLIEAVLKFEKMTFNPATIRKNAQRFSKKKFMNSLNEMVQKSVKK